jgi:two-component system NarL family sensor kinase
VGTENGGVSRSRWAYLLFVLAMAQAAVAVAGTVVVGMSWRDAVDTFVVTNTAMGAAFPLCGVLIARHRPGNPIGWLFLAFGIAHLTTAAAVPIIWYGVLHGWPDASLRALVTVYQAAWPFGIGMCLPLALQLFPTGHPVSPRWRPLVWLTVGSGLLFVAWLGTVPEPVELAWSGVTSLLALDQQDLLQVASPLVLAVYLAAVAGLIVRYVRGDDRTRRQLLWLVLAMIAMLAINWQRWIFPNFEGAILLLLAVPLIPLAVTVAILRYQLFDIRLAVSRTVLYSLLTAGVVAAYGGLVGLLDRFLRGAGAPVMATVLIALAFNPVRVRAQRLVDRTFYGARRDPVRAVSTVGRRIAVDDLAGVVDGIRDALRLPFAALRDAGGELAASGAPPETVHTVPLTYRGGRVGDLLVGVRAGDRRLNAADLAVLDLLATPLAVAQHATRLSQALQASRERLVTATEEERRRLHRELHDSLGPTLTGAALTADAAGNIIGSDPARATQLAAQAGGQIRAAIDEVRRLVYGLRPPALDEVGLSGAIQRHATQLAGEVAITVDSDPHLPQLPAAVEVAAYRIATEAVTNVVRHSGARHAIVSIRADAHTLRLSVTDDGALNGAWRPGVGLGSVAERAAELGGACEAGPTPDGGRLAAQLPLGAGA